MKNVTRREALMMALVLCLGVSFLAACSPPFSPKDSATIRITEIKMARGVDENLMPQTIVDIFPRGTSKVFCWFKWRNAKVNTVILAKWQYVTDDIPVLDNAIVIPRKEGMGSISLAMPEGKTLPSGIYRIDLLLEKKPLKSLSFKVE